MTCPGHSGQRGTNPAPSGSQEWQWRRYLRIKVNLISIYRIQAAIDFPLSIKWKKNIQVHSGLPNLQKLPHVPWHFQSSAIFARKSAKTQKMAHVQTDPYMAKSYF